MTFQKSGDFKDLSFIIKFIQAVNLLSAISGNKLKKPPESNFKNTKNKRLNAAFL